MSAKDKRKRNDEVLPKEEQKRRQRQRELRKVALDLRAKGEQYNPRKHGNNKTTAKKKASKDDDAHKPHKPRRPPSVIIIPIFWQKDKDAVIAAARVCMQHISDAGIKVDLDTTNTHTPGAKFRYWEERGVKFRVELGPEDVTNGTAVLAICGTPGEVAEKHTLAAPGAVVARLRNLVGAAGKTNGQANAPFVLRQKIKRTAVADEGEAQHAVVQRQKTKKVIKKAAVEEPDTNANPAADTSNKVAKWGGGDDAEDDFGVDLLAVQAAPASRGTKGGKGGKRNARCR